MAVSVRPGHTTFTVIFFPASSRARVLVSAMMPPLHAEYSASPEEPTRPASEAMFTTLPPPRSTMPGSTQCSRFIAPIRLMEMIFCQNAGSVLRNGLNMSQPALLTRMSTGPASATAFFTAS